MLARAKVFDFWCFISNRKLQKEGQIEQKNTPEESELYTGGTMKHTTYKHTPTTKAWRPKPRDLRDLWLLDRMPMVIMDLMDQLILKGKQPFIFEQVKSLAPHGKRSG
ncbi:MAG: hypothetical protein H7Y59_20670 [Anaerolineales bacterium]|nr:hypothetical protein [Anaerolineales bacterium]